MVVCCGAGGSGGFVKNKLNNNYMNQLKQIKDLGGRVYIRTKGSTMTMTLRYESTVFTVSDLHNSTSERLRVVNIFLNFIQNDPF
jgi:hypothetical protein